MPRSRLGIAMTLCGLILLIALAVWQAFFRPAAPPVDRELTSEQIVQLIERKNLGLAQLENERPSESAENFLPIVEALPRDPLGPRNLAISRILALGQLDAAREPDRYRKAVEKTRKALLQLRELEPDAMETHVLAARFATAIGDEAAADRELSQAAEQSPDDAAVWFELYATRRDAQTPAVRESARAALQRAYAADSDNLFVLMEWLLSQVDAHDSDIAATLERAERILRPLRESIEQRTRVNVQEQVQQARASAVAADWTAAQRHLRILANVTRPEELTQSDRLRVERHALEFVLERFRPEFYEQLDRHRSPIDDPIAVSMIEIPLDGLTSLRKVTDVLPLDFDLDGASDLLVLEDEHISVYGRARPGRDLVLLAEINAPPGLSHLLAADLDNDLDETLARPESGRHCHTADSEVIAYGRGGVVLFENRREGDGGRRRIVRVPPNDGLEKLKDVNAAALIDLDHDGDLDLVVGASDGISLWANRGDLTWMEISDRSQLPEGFSATAALGVDWDRDVDIDVLLLGEGAGQAGYLENLRHGRFRWRSMKEAFAALRLAEAIDALDVDANLSWDLVTAGPQGLKLTRTRMPVAGVVQPLDEGLVSDFTAARFQLWDYDNDGLLDLVAWNADAVQLYRGLADGRFQPVSDVLPQIEDVLVCRPVDFDDDGDLELVVAEGGRIRLFENRGGNRNQWLDVSLVAQQIKGNQTTASGRVNHYGIGSLLELKAGAHYQSQIVRGQTTHFGLGKRQAADVLRVLWTNGMPHNVLHPQNRAHLCEQQVLKGSCPYLYTWTGAKYEFFTDLLWAAPIGLQFAEGVLAPAREWEYLRIPGDRLIAQDGEYRLQITEELWEAAYFDEVKLLAVDHPSEVEIYSNEKVGPAEMAEHRIHTVRQPRLPVTATDQRGRDVLESIAREDGVFLKAFDRKILQGYTEEHFLELDLGRFESSQPVQLFLTGWVYPTDTSINVALSQNPDLPGPRPPSLWLPDEAGTWREVRSYMGFPGGKTKTIAVDLTGLFAGGDHRLRIVSSMEIYWDAAFFTVGESAETHRVVELELMDADLHARGFSAVLPHAGYGPDRYDYERVTSEPRWPPMDGHFTRYGSVTELLRTSDDRLAVLGSGDEMTLRFRAPTDSLPEGWKRDFLIYNVGWDKDADMNTVYGQTVEPLPFRAMKRYPYAPDQQWPDTPAHRTYLRDYQTRRQSRSAFWKQIREFPMRGVETHQ